MTHAAPRVAGIYGKLPGYGDFLSHYLPKEFVGAWDGWLQAALRTSRERMGGAWLGAYLRGPIWRFAISVPDDGWAGVMMFSTDRVGRCYPFTIAAPLPPGVSPVVMVEGWQDGFAYAESLALAALDESLGFDDLLAAVAELPAAVPPPAPAGALLWPGDERAVALVDPAEDGGEGLADAIARVNEAAPLGLWWHPGSERFPPTRLVCRPYPPAAGFPALLDGDWRRWGWQEPDGP